jgi:hypothetical protein
MDLIGDKGSTLFCTYRLDKGQAAAVLARASASPTPSR